MTFGDLILFFASIES